MKKLILAAPILTLLSFTPACAGGAGSISPADAAASIKQSSESPQAMLLLDVRTNEEWAESHLAGATLIPVQELQSRISEVSAYKDKPVIVYCRSGRRSAQAAEMLNAAGFKNVRNLSGGIQAWQSSGLPVTK